MKCESARLTVLCLAQIFLHGKDSSMHYVVVGSGLMGLCTAYFLACTGQEVTVLERGAGPALESSHGNGGLLSPYMSKPWNEPGIVWEFLKHIGKEDTPFLLRARTIPSLLGWGMQFLRTSGAVASHESMKANVALSYYNFDVMHELCKAESIKYSAAARGSLQIFRSRQSLDHTLMASSKLDENNIHYDILDASSVMSVEPALSGIGKQIIGAIHYKDDEVGDAYRFCRELHIRCERKGVKFQFSTPVKDICVTAGKVHSLATVTGNISADRYILACGSWTPVMARKAGISLPVCPIKGYSITYDSQGWDNLPKIPVADYNLYFAVTPIGLKLRVAGTAELGGYALNMPEERIKYVSGLLAMTFPQYASVAKPGSAKFWCGLRPMSSDGKPIIGPTEIRNLYVNTGHGHYGWTTACGSGKALADFLVNGDCDLDLSQFGLARFNG